MRIRVSRYTVSIFSFSSSISRSISFVTLMIGVESGRKIMVRRTLNAICTIDIWLAVLPLRNGMLSAIAGTE